MRVTHSAGPLFGFALLALLPSASLVADVTYTYVEDLPALSTNDEPTATWTFIWPGTPTPYLNGARTLTGSPTLNAAAIADGYVYDSGDPTFHAGPTAFGGADPTAVLFSILTTTYAPIDTDNCTAPINNTSCPFNNGDMVYDIGGGPSTGSGWGVDTLTISSDASVPEPGSMPVLGAAGVAAAFFGRRRFAR